MPTDLRVRYDEGVRRRAAEMFAEGSGYRATAGELGLPPTTVRKWHRTYAAIGLEGLLSMGGSCSSYSWEVKVAAAKAIAGIISDEERSAENIIPGAFDPRVVEAVSAAVAQAARDSGVARA